MALPPDGQALPTDLAALAWQQIEAVRSADGFEAVDFPGGEAELGLLVLTAFQASLCAEEGRLVRLRLVFHADPAIVTVALGSPVPYRVESLVRLSPTTGLGRRMIVVRPAADGSLEIAGFADPGLVAATDPAVARGLKLVVLGPGFVRIGLRDTAFDLQRGSICQAVSLGSIPPVAAWFEEVARREANDPVLHLGLWSTVVHRIRDVGHGGCFLVLPARRGDGDLPLRLKYRLDSQLLVEALGETSGAALLPAVDLLAHLAAVDGAVVVDRQLGLVGFGCEILSRPVALAGRFLDRSGAATGGPRPDSLESFGMRHRSAAYFCSEVPGSLAFVVSQDGEVSVFSMGDELVERHKVSVATVAHHFGSSER